jgi:hypothetical protein
VDYDLQHHLPEHHVAGHLHDAEVEHLSEHVAGA